jgi:hypothetical protein
VYSALAAVTLTTVRVSGPVAVRIKIEQGAETITGQVAVKDATPVEFYGWLELIGHLEHAARGSITSGGDRSITPAGDMIKAQSSTATALGTD